MPVLNSCCCCCSLRTGGSILGWLGIVCNIINVAIVSAVMAFEDQVNTNLNRGLLHGILSTLLIVAVIDLLAYILLLVGSAKGNRFLILPWLITKLVSIIFFTFIVFGGGIILICVPDHVSDHSYVVYGVLILVFGIPANALQIYWWVCILSLFQQLRENETSVGVVFAPAPSNKPTAPPYYSLPNYEKFEHI